MTRINVVDPSTLHSRHLVAEYRELPRVFALVAKAKKDWYKKQPQSYCMREGHAIFFYNKLKYLADRQKLLVDEMLKRGYSPQHTECLEKQWRGKIPDNYWFDYQPTEEAIKVNQERIDTRLKGMK